MTFSDFRDMIQDVAVRKGWDPALLAAQAWAESGFNPSAVSTAGAKGIMQFMDRTWTSFSGGRSVWDPLASFEGAVDYLQHIVQFLGGGLASPTELTLAAYNWGEGNVQKLIRTTGRTDWAYLVTVPHPTKPGKRWVPDETRTYVARILAKAADYQRSFQDGTTQDAMPVDGEPDPEPSGLAADARDFFTGQAGWSSYAMAGAIVLAALLGVLLLRRALQ